MDDSCTTISYHQIERTIRPLRLLFWGGMICVIDVSIGINDWEFDFLNDALGMWLIAISVRRLAEIDAPRPYPRIMHWVQIAAWLSFAEAIFDQFPVDIPAVLSLLIAVLGLGLTVAIVAFCYAMRLFCQHSEMPQSERSWKLTMRLFIVFLLIPLGLFYQLGMIAVLTGRSFHVDLGPFAILLVLFVVPIVHLFVSTSRMKREAGIRLDAAPLPAILR